MNDIRSPFLRWRKTRRTLWLLLAGAFLVCCILPSQTLSLPTALEPLSRAMYRFAFILIIPARILAAIPLPIDHHHHWPLANLLISSFATPFLYAGLHRLGSRALGCHYMKRRGGAAGTKHPAPRMARREFLARSTATAAGLAAVGAGGYASWFEPSTLKTRYYDISIEGLPPRLDGLRIAHVSDTHYGPFISRIFLERIARHVNSLSPDLVALTGDYVHMTPRAIDVGVGLMGLFQGRLGVVAVLGNHDHWEGARACRARFADIGVPLLDNRRLFLGPAGLSRVAPAGPAVCVAGVSDLWEDRVSFDQALDGVPDDMPRILLSHNPDVAERAHASHRIALMLSGHTHGGQIYLPGYGPLGRVSSYGLKYIGGICEGPYFPVVVSRGVGMAFVPVRCGVPPEVGLITVRRA